METIPVCRPRAAAADEAVWGWWTGFPVRGGSLKQQGATLSRLLQDGLLSGPEYDQAHRLLAAEAAPQPIPGTRRQSA